VPHLMGDSLHFHVAAPRRVASLRRVSDPRPGALPFGAALQSDERRETGDKGHVVEWMGVDESHRACVTDFLHWRASLRQVRPPTLAFSWKLRMVVAHHDAFPVPSGPSVAWGQHYPFLVLGDASRGVGVEGTQTWEMASDCHAFHVAVQDGESPVDKASMGVAEHRLGARFRGPY
jgi:hypothetical protein